MSDSSTARSPLRRRIAAGGPFFETVETVRKRGRILLCIVPLGLAGACAQEVERVPDAFRPTNAHEAYRYGLITADLSATALGRDWIAAAEGALRAPVAISPPFRESGYFDASSAAAVGYVFEARGGQRIEAEVLVSAGEPLRLFMDLFRLVDDDPAAPIHVATGAAAAAAEAGATIAERGDADRAAESLRVLRLEPLRDGTYVLRLQPELLRSARYTVQVRIDGSLGFPVAGRDTGAIQSGFGAPRDAGRRRHHGVDIFAPRGTPVVAAADGVAYRVDTTAVGGNIVWLREDRRDVRHYYAHLDTQTVQRGQRVRAGEQLGTVGNTGNARTTPPHLHFGVYSRGPTDPVPFLQRNRRDPVEISVDAARIGEWHRTRQAAVPLLAAPDSRAPVIAYLDQLAPVQIWGASARWYRVTLPDGGSGYVAGDATEAPTPLRRAALAAGSEVLDRPAPRGAVITQLGAGEEVPVLGSFGSFWYVQTPAGLMGWLSFE